MFVDCDVTWGLWKLRQLLPKSPLIILDPDVVDINPSNKDLILEHFISKYVWPDYKNIILYTQTHKNVGE
jgi:hypothetical protein